MREGKFSAVKRLTLTFQELVNPSSESVKCKGAKPWSLNLGVVAYLYLINVLLVNQIFCLGF